MTIDDAALDAHLKNWATAPAGDPAVIERIINKAADAVPSRPSRWWAVPGLAAAALAGVLLLKPADRPTPAPDVAPAVAPDATFDALFTPTPDEEAFT